MANTTSIAVGCAVGIPVFLSLLVAGFFFTKTRRRLAREDEAFALDQEMNDIDRDISYDQVEDLKIKRKEEERQQTPFGTNTDPSSVSSDDGKIHDKQSISQQTDSSPSSPKQEANSKKKNRFVPAYRKQLRTSMTNLASSRNSSFSNLNHNGGLVQGSNSSINTSTTNQTDLFYSSVVPVMDTPDTPSKQLNSLHMDNGSIELARSLQQPTPSYSKRPSNTRSSSNSINGDEQDYSLKNNYDHSNDFEIQEEDQYENEFTNYSENKREFIQSLRPKVKQ